MRTSIITLVAALIVSISAHGQDEYEEAPRARPKGGMVQLYAYFNENIEYPLEAYNASVEGQILIEFIIDLNGNVKPESIKILKGLGYGLDEAAIGLIQKMPTWSPAMDTKTNSTVEYRERVPINFFKSKTSIAEVNSLHSIDLMLGLYDQEKYAEALQLINETIEQYKKYGSNYYARALIYQAMGDQKRACADYSKAVKIGYRKLKFDGRSIVCS